MTGARTLYEIPSTSNGNRAAYARDHTGCQLQYTQLHITYAADHAVISVATCDALTSGVSRQIKKATTVFDITPHIVKV